MTPVSLTLSVTPVNMPTRLQCLDVPIVGDEECQKAYPGMITRRMMCAGYMDGGRDACNVSLTVNLRWTHSPLCRIHHCASAQTCSLCLSG